MSSKTLHVTFARMNPPTTAHIDLIQQMQNAGDSYVVLSTKQNDKNPLHYLYRTTILRSVISSRNVGCANDLFDAMDLVDHICKERGYKKIVIWAGTDRIPAMERVKLYPDRWSFKVKDICEIPRPVDGVSATAARAAVVNNQYDLFKSLIGAPEELHEDLYKHLQEVLTNGSLESTTKTGKRRVKRS